MNPSSLAIRKFNSIGELRPTDWAPLATEAGPCLQYEFLVALESSGSVCNNTGWRGSHLGIFRDEQLIGALPLYLKSHSYGEYIFDFGWAHAYQQRGLAYYPKLVNAIPFTPVTDQRLLVLPDEDAAYLWQQCWPKIQSLLEICSASSFHSLYLNSNESARLAETGAASRLSIAYRWHNQGYSSFEAYLSMMTSRRRKSIRKERRSLSHLAFKQYSGSQISPQIVSFFYRCYQMSYLKLSGHGGYLNEDFFQRLRQSFADNLLVVVAEDGGTPIASALYLFNQHMLCGRYWGAIEPRDNLHFECCYYQGIEFAIKHKLPVFDPGTQGEHKVMRGFEPVLSYSNHFIKSPVFAPAIEQFICQESDQMKRYKKQLQSLLPFRVTDAAN